MSHGFNKSWLCAAKLTHATEPDMVSHILKVSVDDTFNFFVFNNEATVDAAIKECCWLKPAKSRHVNQQFARLSSTSATSSCADAPHPNNTSDVSRNLRREIEAAYPAAFESSSANKPAVTVSLIRAVVCQEDNLSLA